MYELALGIDVREMANSRFHQTQQEAAGLNCQMSLPFFFLLFYGVVTSLPFGSKSPRVKKKTRGFVPSARGTLVFV